MTKEELQELRCEIDRVKAIIGAIQKMDHVNSLNIAYGLAKTHLYLYELLAKELLAKDEHGMYIHGEGYDKIKISTP